MSDAFSLEIETTQGRHVINVPPQRRHERLTDLLRKANLPLNTRCGQHGVCDGCIVELLAGTLAHAKTGEVISAGIDPVSVRGCEHRVESGGGAVKLRIPPRSLLAYQPQVVTEFRVNVPRAHDPLVSFREVQRSLGAAIDVGTTTVAVLLVDLADGKILSQAAAFNQQMNLGDDVVTRISLCCNDSANVSQLQHAVAARTIAPLLREALSKAGASADEVACLSVAGNTTMLHLLTGVNPAPMGTAPFTPVFLDHRVYRASEIFKTACDQACRADAPVHLLPGSAAYVGADLSAGIVATGLLYDDGPSLLVDVGTNGEIILKHHGKLYGCATAAGPAFEGAGLSCGIRAGAGAITRISLNKEPFAVRTKWIDHTPHGKPVGLCGSAYIDFLSEARRIGLLTPTGRFDRDAVPDASSRLISWNERDTALRIAYAPGRQDIVISQLDISRLLQAKAAIAAGLLTLLHRVGLAPADIKTLYLAGGFGTHMDRTHAIGCGLLPGFSAAQIQTVGNSSLAGAYLALLDRGIVNELSKIGRNMEIVELNLDPEFESRYIDQLTLPDVAEARAT